MQKSFGQSDPKIIEYVEKLLQPEDPILKASREYSLEQGLPAIQVGAMDALHLEVLARALGAKKTVEIGTLGGYSGIALCRGMGAGGKLHTFEAQAHNAEVARRNFERAGVMEQVEIHVGAALSALPRIEAQGPFDLVFIDADKVSYPQYLTWARDNLRTGGAVLADNTFGWGMVVDDAILDDENALAVRGLREFNKKMASPGSGFRATMLPTGEGLTLAVKI